MSQIVRDRRGEKQIVLYDEGPLHNAHNLFVHLSSEPQLDAIHRFVRLTPLPDLVVYVKEAEPVLIERIIKRGHRRIADLSAENVARFVRRATATFDELVQDPAVQRRLMVVAAGQQAALPRG
ncbi:MAG TPA: hypothetical protein VE553_03935, partial [Candidatus Binatia bacterium]|nr:hypothetical protein [Candidatus Binatia bacterium]